MQGQLASTYLPAPRDAPPRSELSINYGEGVVETTVLWRILWHRRKWIALSGAIFAIAALAYCLISPSLFTASAQIIVDPRDKQVVSNDINPSSVSPDGGIAQVESQVSVVQSGGVLLRAIAATNLEADPEFNGTSFSGGILALFGQPREGIESDLQAKTLAALRKRLAVKRADKVLVIDVSVTSRDADKAARLANAIADAYLADQAQARADAGNQASSALTARLAELQGRVKDAENAVEDYRAANKLVVSSGQLVSDQQLNELTAQLSVAQSRTSTLKAQLDQLRRNNSSADGTTEAMNSAVITKLRDHESALVEKVASLGTQLGPSHPEYAAAQAELQHVQTLITREVDRLGKATRVDYERALADERALSGKLDQLKSQSLDDDKADVRLHELQREVEAVRSVYANFLVRAKETGEQASVDSTNARIITRALRPQQRSWPPLALLLVGAAFAGLGVGASASLTHEYMAPLVMSGGQIRSISGATVIGALPAGGPAPSYWLNRAAEISPPSAIVPREENVDALSHRVIQLLLAKLLNGDVGDRRRYAARSLIVTSSATDGPERSRVAELIAAVAARNGERVLLIDADVGGEKETAFPGFQDLLRHDCMIDSVMHSSGTSEYLRIDKGRRDSEQRDIPRREIDETQFARAFRYFDLTVIDAGALTDNYKVGPLVADADEVLLVAELFMTPQSAVVAEAEVAALMGRPLTSVVLVDKTLRA
jgi:uncharacterized protein involved in exopolysaccharide biosynthesis/Mrp family chromosome partitioning ATPase